MVSEEIGRLEAELEKQERIQLTLRDERDKAVSEVQRLSNLDVQMQSKGGKMSEKIKELQQELETKDELVRYHLLDSNLK